MSIEQEPGKIKKDILKTVLKIEIPNGKIGRQPTGTGFLISKQTDNRYFLVTNKHVVGDWNSADGNILNYYKKVLIFPYKKDELGGGYSKIAINLVDSSGKLSDKLKIHKNPLVDIAIIDVTNELNIDTSLYITRLDTSFLLFFNNIYEGQKYGIGDDVFALGYPLGITSTKNNLPIAKSIRIASLPGEEFSVDFPCKNRQGIIKDVIISGKLIIVDGLIVGGNSGGPVVLPVGIRFRYHDTKGFQYTKGEGNNLVLGIVSSTLGQSGINVIYSSDYIKELLDEFL
jgi:hypothetical protein